MITIVDTIDGKDLFDECGLGLNISSSEYPCRIHDDYKKGREIIQDLFMTKTINVLCEPVGRGLAHLID